MLQDHIKTTKLKNKSSKIYKAATQAILQKVTLSKKKKKASMNMSIMMKIIRMSFNKNLDRPKE